jgi:hypothetical protein
MSIRVLRPIPTVIWASVALVWFPLARAADAPLIVLDSAWNRSMARQLCSLPGFREALPPDVAASCPFDPLAGYLDYESRLITQFASATKCKGIRVLTHKPKDRLNSYWDLPIYHPGEPAQNWKLSPPLERQDVPYCRSLGARSRRAYSELRCVTCAWPRSPRWI